MGTRLLAGLVALALITAGSVGGGQSAGATAERSEAAQADCDYAALYDAAADGAVTIPFAPGVNAMVPGRSRPTPRSNPATAADRGWTAGVARSA